TASVRVDPQDPTADLLPWQASMLRRIMNTRRAEPVRCGPKPLLLKATGPGKPVDPECLEPEPEATTSEAMSVQLELLRDQIALAQNGGLELTKETVEAFKE
ncbi:MAG: hypothetical protein ABI824_12385, partial [Acidobacteriota bacterium]